MFDDRIGFDEGGVRIVCWVDDGIDAPAARRIRPSGLPGALVVTPISAVRPPRKNDVCRSAVYRGDADAEEIKRPRDPMKAATNLFAEVCCKARAASRPLRT